MKKEFGKVTADQLLVLLKYMPVMEALNAELLDTLRENLDRTAELAPKGFRWASIYEQPIEHHLALIIVLMTKPEQVLHLARNPELIESAIQDFRRDEALLPGINSSWFGERHSPGFLVGLVMALQFSFDAVCLYGRYLHELIAEARSASPERDKALFNAIRIDPSVISGPTAARRLSTALAMRDECFVAGLRLAMEGKTGNQMAYLRKFRYAIKILAESNGLQGSPKALATRLVELGIYPDGPTAIKNAAELIRKAKKIHAI